MAPSCLTGGQVNAGLIALAVLGGILPALFWLWFWLKEDKRRPEPKRLITLTFLLGAFSIFLAFFFEHAVADFLNINLSPASLAGYSALQLAGLVLTLSLIEETLKYAAVYLAAFRSRHFDEPVDAMVYMITGALGFAAMENTFFMLSSLCAQGTNQLEFLFTGNFRFIGATILHLVASSLVGAMIALAFRQSRARRFIFSFAGLALATALHALFNYSIIKSTQSSQILNTFILLWVSALAVLLLFEKVKFKQYLCFKKSDLSLND